MTQLWHQRLLDNKLVGLRRSRMILFTHTAELSHVIARHGLKFHQYADDCQIYVSSPVSAVQSAIEQFSHCLQDVEAWMSASRLRLNPSSTVVLWLGSRHIIDKLDVHEVQVLSSTVKVDSSARDLGLSTTRTTPANKKSLNASASIEQNVL